MTSLVKSLSSWSKMTNLVKSWSSWSKMTNLVKTWSSWSKMTNLVKLVKSWSSWSKMTSLAKRVKSWSKVGQKLVKNDKLGQKLVKFVKNCKFGQKLVKLVKNWPTWSSWPKVGRVGQKWLSCSICHQLDQVLTNLTKLVNFWPTWPSHWDACGPKLISHGLTMFSQAHACSDYKQKRKWTRNWQRKDELQVEATWNSTHVRLNILRILINPKMVVVSSRRNACFWTYAPE